MFDIINELLNESTVMFISQEFLCYKIINLFVFDIMDL